jgi:hypothetical protein
MRVVRRLYLRYVGEFAEGESDLPHCYIDHDWRNRLKRLCFSNGLFLARNDTIL